jgi:hypothetical protein
LPTLFFQIKCSSLYVFVVNFCPKLNHSFSWQFLCKIWLNTDFGFLLWRLGSVYPLYQNFDSKKFWQLLNLLRDNCSSKTKKRTSKNVMNNCDELMENFRETEGNCW